MYIKILVSESDANALGIGSLAELPNEAEENFSESDDSEKEDDIIKPNDNLILVGRIDGDASIFEVYGTLKPTYVVTFLHGVNNIFSIQ